MDATSALAPPDEAVPPVALEFVPVVRRSQQIITALLLLAPFAGVLTAIVWLFGRGVTVLDLGLLVVFYAISGHGLTAGYHRMLAHRGFVATRGTKIGLCVAGSLGFEGAAIGWVANHRRHHAYTDIAGDPHSPHLDRHARWSRTRGALHAHVGWLFGADGTDANRWAADLVADRDLVLISRLFPLFCIVSLGAPALIGWAVISGTAAGAGRRGSSGVASSGSSSCSTPPSP